MGRSTTEYILQSAMAAKETGAGLLLRFDKNTYSTKKPSNIFLERIMIDALENHKGSVSIGGHILIYFQFADDIVVNAVERE